MVKNNKLIFLTPLREIMEAISDLALYMDYIDFSKGFENESILILKQLQIYYNNLVEYKDSMECLNSNIIYVYTINNKFDIYVADTLGMVLEYIFHIKVDYNYSNYFLERSFKYQMYDYKPLNRVLNNLGVDKIDFINENFDLSWLYEEDLSDTVDIEEEEYDRLGDNNYGVFYNRQYKTELLYLVDAYKPLPKTIKANCPICLSDTVCWVLDCHPLHFLCDGCYNDIEKHNPKCPICRSKLQKNIEIKLEWDIQDNIYEEDFLLHSNIDIFKGNTIDDVKFRKKQYNKHKKDILQNLHNQHITKQYIDDIDTDELMFPSDISDINSEDIGDIDYDDIVL